MILELCNFVKSDRKGCSVNCFDIMFFFFIFLVSDELYNFDLN